MTSEPIRIKRSLAALALFVFAAVGCSKTPSEEDNPPGPGKKPIEAIGKSYLPSVGRIDPSNDLRQFFQLYQVYLNDSGRPLTKLEDLKTMSLDREAPKIYQAFMDGRYAFNFKAGATLGHAKILCYEKDPGRKGGSVVVLLGDGSVQTMTEDQFQKNLKADGS